MDVWNLIFVSLVPSLPHPTVLSVRSLKVIKPKSTVPRVILLFISSFILWTFLCKNANAVAVLSAHSGNGLFILYSVLSVRPTSVTTTTIGRRPEKREPNSRILSLLETEFPSK